MSTSYDIAAVDIKNKTHIYHHQNYMLQFKHNTKVHRLETRGTNIPKFSFNFCPFDNLPEKDTFAKPLQDIIGVISHLIMQVRHVQINSGKSKFKT